MATPGRAVRLDNIQSNSIVFSQPKLFDYIANTPENSIHNRTRSKTNSESKSLSNPPERQQQIKSKKIKKAEKKSQRKRNTLPSSPPQSPTATRTISQMLNSVYDSPPASPSPPDSPSPSSSPSNTDQTDIPLDEQLANCKILISYLEKENTAIKNERDLINDDLSTANKLLDKQKKMNKKLTTECDQLKRNASKKSGVRKSMNIDISTQTDSLSQSHPQCQAESQPNDIVVAQLISLRDHVTKVANDLLQSVDSVPSHQPSQPSSQPPSQPPPSQQSHETPFTPVRNKRRMNKPPPPPTYRDAAENGTRTNTSSSHQQSTAPPSHAHATSVHRRPGQGARYRNKKKVIFITTSLGDGLSSELRSHGIDSTTHIYRGGKIDLIRERVPHLFSKDISKQPDKIVILAGGNDAEETTADRTINSYEGLVRDIRKVCNHSKILLNSIPHRKNDSKTNRKIDEVNDYLADRGQRKDNVQFMNIAPVESHFFTSKKVHFNQRGKSLLASRLKPFLVD